QYRGHGVTECVLVTTAHWARLTVVARETCVVGRGSEGTIMAEVRPESVDSDDDFVYVTAGKSESYEGDDCPDGWLLVEEDADDHYIISHLSDLTQQHTSSPLQGIQHQKHFQFSQRSYKNLLEEESSKQNIEETMQCESVNVQESELNENCKVSELEAAMHFSTDDEDQDNVMDIYISKRAKMQRKLDVFGNRSRHKNAKRKTNGYSYIYTKPYIFDPY
ncbi:hypothetical protein OTU49_004882, partial [Cherax quadricarinatus]